jgi:hypothetical protein
MKYRQFIPPFSPHDPDTLDQGELEAIDEIFGAKFMAWHYTHRTRTKAESFSFQLNEGAPTSTLPNPPQYLVNIDMPGNAHYVIGHLWLSVDELAEAKPFLDGVYPIESVYTGNEHVFQPQELE